jgi:AcrR family transcriptional regulator
VARRLRRPEQVQRNRELVIAAAQRVFLARGYAGATLGAIADEAGFSKGVVYSQFESKADLFLTLLERRIAERTRENARVVGKLTGLAAIRAWFRAGVRDARVHAGWAGVLVEFRIVAARDPALNRRYAAVHERTIAQIEELLVRVHAGAGVAPAFPPRVMAELSLALGSGVALERAASPDALPARLVEAMFLKALGWAGREEEPR